MPENARNHARNSPLPLRHMDFHLTHESLGPPHSPSQTAPGSNQPFRHSSYVRTDRWGGRLFSANSASLAMLIESDALIMIGHGIGMVAVAAPALRIHQVLARS